MFIPIIIPTSVRTKKNWITDIMNIPFLGGYLIILIALLPPFVGGLIVATILSLLSTLFSQNHWILTTFLFGILLFFWDRWLRWSYRTEIKIIHIPLEFFAYVTLMIALIFAYA